MIKLVVTYIISLLVIKVKLFMFIRRRGCRLQIVRAFRDQNGKPTNQSLGTVGVFDQKIGADLAEQLTKSERVWLRGKMAEAAAECVAESREVLERLIDCKDSISDRDLKSTIIYRSLLNLVGVCLSTTPGSKIC